MIIIGGGPAAYTAALYAARAKLAPVVIEGYLPGGLLAQTTEVENYPGFLDGILGPDLMAVMRGQAERFGTQFVSDWVQRIASHADGTFQIDTAGNTWTAQTVILAMGSKPRTLGVPGEDTLLGKGLSYCATCDAPFFADRRIAVIGGGDSAMEEALHLAKYGEEVFLIHRRDEFRASRWMLDRAKATPNIHFLTPWKVSEAHEQDNKLHHLLLHNTDTSEQQTLLVDGLFVAIGHTPQSELLTDLLNLDEDGYVVPVGRSSATSRPGMFVAGDLADRVYKQAITAAGSGAAAALDAEHYLLGQQPASPPST